MRTKEQIKAQREFSVAVYKRIAEMGLLHNFVAENIGLSAARLSQYLKNFRQIPPKTKVLLMHFLRMDVPQIPQKTPDSKNKFTPKAQ